jgi:hypothetical protein
MILVDSLLYKLDQRLNRLATTIHQNIPLEDKILVLNDAQLKLIKSKVSGIFLAGGLESFKKRYEDLSILIEGYKKLKVKEDNTGPVLTYKASRKDIKPEMLFFLGGYVDATKGKCENQKLWLNQGLVKHGDITLLLNTPDFKPSFEYRETFCSVGGDSITVYTDGTFKVNNLFIVYVRYPQKIDKAGYIGFDGTPSVDSNCELPEYLETELLDVAENMIAEYTANQFSTEASARRMVTNNQ